MSASGLAAGHAAPPDLPYRIPWRTREIRGGAHRGVFSGSGGLFRDFVSIFEHPDPRRIDLRATARDPLDAIHVRRFEQMSTITLYALVDVSASMGFAARRKIDLAAELVLALASSARRAGDAFGLIGCDVRVREELFLPATRSQSSHQEMVDRLRAFQLDQAGARGLVQGAALIAGRRKLVFLISDFLMPSDALVEVFRALAEHDIVPIVLALGSELVALPKWGLLLLTDLETGRRRLVAMRPSLRDAWTKGAEERRAGFRAIANRYGRRPFEIVDRIDWTRLASHLME